MRPTSSTRASRRNTKLLECSPAIRLRTRSSRGTTLDGHQALVRLAAVVHQHRGADESGRRRVLSKTAICAVELAAAATCRRRRERRRTRIRSKDAGVARAGQAPDPLVHHRAVSVRGAGLDIGQLSCAGVEDDDDLDVPWIVWSMMLCTASRISSGRRCVGTTAVTAGRRPRPFRPRAGSRSPPSRCRRKKARNIVLEVCRVYGK